MTLLTVNRVNHYYGQSHTLRDVTLDIPSAACTCLMGRNGVGKTTFAKCLMGLEQPRSGEMLFGSDALEKQPAEFRAPAGIGYVPQGRQIFPLLSVEENIRTGFFSLKTKSRDIPPRLYELFPVLAEMKNRRGGDLSGGQQQQLAIARALVLEPRLLILDEPAEGIQPSIVQEIADVIRALSTEMNIAVLLIEQKLPFIRKVADRFAIMERGSIVAGGDMDQLSEDLVNEYLVV
jgi:urea transport system ATP-binding protein